MSHFDQLKSLGFIEHHKCAACGSPVGYTVHPLYAAAVFDSGCDCSGGSSYRVLEHGELEALFADRATGPNASYGGL